MNQRSIMNIVFSDSRPLDQDETEFRRKALRDSVILIGSLKFISFICYSGLYVMVVLNGGKTHISKVIQYMILAVIPSIILNATFLILGALEGRIWALEIGLWLCLIIAAYETVVNVMGAVYFIRTGYLTVHFLIAVVFTISAVFISFGLFSDVILIYAYIKILRSSVT